MIKARPKLVEINRSSGSEALDRAATEAIKHWRFHPARSGDKPVESWVSIPIEFRLEDLRNYRERHRGGKQASLINRRRIKGKR